MTVAGYKSFLFKEYVPYGDNKQDKMVGLKKTGSNNCLICFYPTDLSGYPTIGTIVTRYERRSHPNNNNAQIRMWGKTSPGNSYHMCNNCKHGVMSWGYNSRITSNEVCYESTGGDNFYFQNIQVFENVELGFHNLLTVDYFGYE